ncbi:MAG: GNAT family N-acetyltransferase [Oscillospiraceae bacterium]|jgi:ribosomal protein S18 acetylase RimI-like enzyme|nr:GNAT family N-acetyltransferase [Oscillospiraceae bacterium]
MANITIHTASPGDCAGIYPLICALASDGWDGAGTAYQPPFAEYAKTFQRILRDESKQYFVAKEGENSIGVAGLTVNRSLVEAGDFAFIEELVVAADSRRNGAGQLLLAACIAFAKQQQCQSVALSTGAARYAAHRLYEKSGFTRVGVTYVMDLT